MELFFYTVLVHFTLIIAFLCPSYDTLQTFRSFYQLEKRADSLAAEEQHAEALQIYRHLRMDSLQDDQTKNRLRYKTGFSLMHAGREKEAQPWFRQVLKRTADRNLKCDAMTGLGRTYEYTGFRDSAFIWYLEAYRLVEMTGDTLRQARGARNIAQLLRVLGRFEEAGRYCHQAIRLIPGINDYKIVANIYNETAYLFELAGELDSASFFYHHLIAFSIERGYKQGESVGYSNLASVREKQNRCREALELKQKGLEIDRQMGNVYGLMNSYRGLAETYALMGEKRPGIEALDEALLLCDTSWIADLAGIHMSYYLLLKNSGDPAGALQHLEKHMELQNRINDDQSRKTVMDMLAAYEWEKQEKEIRLLEQSDQLKTSRMRLQWLLVGLLVLMGLLILVVGWSVIRHKNQKLKEMKTGLQHFLLHEKKSGSPALYFNNIPHEAIAEKWGLTARESEILYLLGQGCSNAKIAAQLFISANTVKFHIKNIYIKLNVKSRMEAVLRCSEHDPSGTLSH